MLPNRVFIHGLESTSQGTKGVYFRKNFPDMLIDDYTGPLEERMTKLTTLMEGKDRLILVGSSYGGLMAAMFAASHPERVVKLILLAPALSLPDFEPYRHHRLDMPVILYHGRFDDVVPPDTVRGIAQEVFSNLQYHLVDEDHSLNRIFSTLPWGGLLKDRPVDD